MQKKDPPGQRGEAGAAPLAGATPPAKRNKMEEVATGSLKDSDDESNEPEPT